MEAPKTDAPELSKVRLNWGGSGNILVSLALEKGYLADEGIEIEFVPATSNNDMLTLLQSGQVDIKPNYFAITGAVMDLGYEKPLEAAEWMPLSYNDAVAALMRGEIKYALVGTSQNYPVKQLVEEGQVEIVSWHGDIMPYYSCCRMEASTEFVKNNPNTIKAILRALLRAQSYFESHKDECPPSWLTFRALTWKLSKHSC